jgi:hypothetical protein
MEGRGVANYEAGTPSYGFSIATTEFDDALISRGIVTFEQAMIAKGASPSEARRLTELNAMGEGDVLSGLNANCFNDSSNIRRLGDGHDIESHASDDINDDDDDDEFIKKYRENRIHELKTGTNQEYGDVIPISRPDWNREVNEASKTGLWVLVNLTLCSTSHSVTHDEICYKVEDVTKLLASKFVNVKFVSIPSTAAIEDWPVDNLPTIFCYRYGKMQHQLIGIETLGGAGVNAGRLEWRLALLGVVQTELEEDPRPSRTENIVFNSDRGQFGGGMSKLATTRQYESDDFDDVD